MAFFVQSSSPQFGLFVRLLTGTKNNFLARTTALSQLDPKARVCEKKREKKRLGHYFFSEIRKLLILSESWLIFGFQKICNIWKLRLLLIGKITKGETPSKLIIFL